MGFTHLTEYIAGQEVPRTLVPFASIVSEAQSVVIPHGMTLPSDVRNIYRNSLGSFRLPNGRPTAVRDAESCVLLWDTASAQTGLKSDRSFLMVGTVPEMFAKAGNSGIISRQFQQIELASGATSISLFWGTVAAIKYRKRRRDNFDGVCPLRGWHFRNFKTEVSITLEGTQSYLLLSIQPTVCAVVLAAIEKLAYLTTR